MNTDTIISTINSLFGNLFSSIDDSIYSALDDISFINTDIYKSYYFEKLIGTNTSSGILLIANALLIGFILYYAINHLLCSFNIITSNVSSPLQFFFKILLSGLLMNSSFFICNNIINLNSLISSSIREFGESQLNTSICFSGLIEKINLIINLESSNTNTFSIDGILKLIISFSFFNIIFSYSVRYIMLKLFILISPVAFLSLCLPNTSIFFKSWLKSFFALLLIEDFASLILIIMFSICYSSADITSKLLLIGSIFALIKLNSFVRDFIGGISTDVSDNMYILRNFVK